MVFSAARRAGMGSCGFMRSPLELELHDGIGWPESVGEFLRYSRALSRARASAAEPIRAPEDHTIRRGVRSGSTYRAAGDWGVSCSGTAHVAQHRRADRGSVPEEV